jgi:hypothetical protein
VNRGKYILNKEKYRAKTVDRIEPHTSVNIEYKVILEKQIIRHWLVKTLPNEFVVNSHATWFSHNFCVKQKQLQFKILAECTKGAMIIEHDNTIGCGFNIMSKYGCSTELLENFITQKFNEIQNGPFISMSERVSRIPSHTYNISASNVGELEKKHKQRPCTTSIVFNSTPYANEQSALHMATHVGFGFSKRNMIFVEHNTINNRPVSHMIKMRKESSNNSLEDSNGSGSNSNTFRDGQGGPQISTLLKDSNIFDNNNEIIRGLSEFKRSGKNNRIAEIFEDDKKKLNTIEDIREHINKIDRNNNPYLNFVDCEKFNDDQLIDFYKKKRRMITQNLIELTYHIDNNANKLKSRTRSGIPKTPSNLKSPGDDDLKRLLVKEEKPIDEEENNAFGILYPYVNQEFFAKYALDRNTKVYLTS